MCERAPIAPAEEVLRLEQVRKAFNIGTPLETEVLHGIDLQLRRAASWPRWSARPAPARALC